MNDEFRYDADAALERKRAARSDEPDLSQGLRQSCDQSGEDRRAGGDQSRSATTETKSTACTSSPDSAADRSEAPPPAALSQMSQWSQAATRLLTEAELEDFEERAGILEYDEHHSRDEAERLALQRILRTRA